MKKILSIIVLILSLAAPAWSADTLAESWGKVKDATAEALGKTADETGQAPGKAKDATVRTWGRVTGQEEPQAPGRPAPREFEATVQRVTDGDTIIVRTTDAEDIKIRLYGIDAPEHDQEGGAAATKALKPLQGRQVKIREMDTDPRIVALAEHEGRSVNLEQAKQGQAWYYAHFCKEQPICGEMEAAEKEAREAKRGLWAEGWFWAKKVEPVPPWEWRRKK
jgi:endonuclease YncB( thermonuclease family)